MMLAAVFLTILSFKYVNAAQCSSTTGWVCEETAFTNATCGTNGVCDCKTGFPIPSGCSKNIDKPTVKLWDTSKGNVIFTGASATLICSVNSKETAALNFQWKKDDVILVAETKQEFAITSASATTVGIFRCRAMFNRVNASDESDPFSISLWNEVTVSSSAGSSVTMTLTGVPQSVASGASYNATCSGIPIGVDPVFYLNDQDTVINPIDTTKVGKLMCGYQQQRSPAVNTSSIVSSITGAEIKVEGAVDTEFIYKTGTNVSIICMSQPRDIYMNVPKQEVSYKFMDVQNTSLPPKSFASKSYVPDSKGSHIIWCEAAYVKQTINSTNKTIVFSDNYITTPVLTSFGTNLLEGSRLVLKCGDPQVNVTYSWTKDGKPIYIQHDHTVQIDNVTDSEIGVYACAAAKSNYVVLSNIININLTVEIKQPSINGSENESKFYEAENYILVCKTASATRGMTYTWFKDAIGLNGTSRNYALNNVSSNDNGKYTCQASFQNKTSGSGNFTLTVDKPFPGKICDPFAAKPACSGTEYTGVCSNKKPYRCECQKGYTTKDKVCQKGIAVISSVVLVAAGVIFSRLM